MTERRRGLWTGLWLTVALSAFGCSEGGGSGGSSGSSGSVEINYCEDGQEGSDDCIPRPFEYADVEEPYPADDANACKAFSQADEGLTEEQASRRECFCDSCLELMRQCDALPGCTEMRQCAWRTGCNGPYACYLLPGAPCRDVIDEWGNGSVSAAINTELGECGCL